MFLWMIASLILSLILIIYFSIWTGATIIRIWHRHRSISFLIHFLKSPFHPFLNTFNISIGPIILSTTINLVRILNIVGGISLSLFKLYRSPVLTNCKSIVIIALFHYAVLLFILSDHTYIFCFTNSIFSSFL